MLRSWWGKTAGISLSCSGFERFSWLRCASWPFCDRSAVLVGVWKAAPFALLLSQSMAMRNPTCLLGFGLSIFGMEWLKNHIFLRPLLFLGRELVCLVFRVFSTSFPVFMGLLLVVYRAVWSSLCCVLLIVFILLMYRQFEAAFRSISLVSLLLLAQFLLEKHELVQS